MDTTDGLLSEVRWIGNRVNRRSSMADVDPFQTQRDAGSAVVSELHAAGFDDAEEIGRGGFGIVYRCVQIGLGRTVAVKVLTADLGENRERFVREQRAMGLLTGHPNSSACCRSAKPRAVLHIW